MGWGDTVLYAAHFALDSEDLATLALVLLSIGPPVLVYRCFATPL